MLYSVSFAEYAAPAVSPIQSALFTFLPLLFILVAVVFGLITKHINESKGYKGGFAWGFFLAIIGIIVVALKPFNPSVAQQANATTTGQSVPDEIKKYKDLLDQGIITEEEFANKKNQLLNLNSNRQ